MDNKKYGTRRAVKRIFALVLAVVLMMSAAVVGAAAQGSENRMNVMLVIDGSGSLTRKENPTDRDGLRYDAIDLFLALLTNKGNNVGAVVFNGESDSFRLYEGLTEMNGKDAKMGLSASIEEAGTGGGTNIGAAMLKAVEEASSMSQSNGLPAVVILFSDGKTEDVKGEIEDSLEAKENATVLAQESDIPVYTICLNANGKADPDEMREIAERTSGAFVTVDEAEDLASAFEAFYKLIFSSVGDEIQESSYPADGELEFTVPIPAYGAEEVNIILDTTDLKEKTITAPSGTLSDADVAEYTMSGGSYDVIKLVDPEPGEWTVTLIGVPEESVTIHVLYNIDSSVELRTADGASEYSTGDAVTLQASLLQGGSVVHDSAITNEYNAVLTLTNLADGTVQELNMVPGSDGTFSYTMQGNEYASYSASVTMSYSNLVMESNEVSISFGNTAPMATPDYMEVEMTVTPISGRSASYKLTDYFSDAQDSNLTYSIISSQLVQDTVDLNAQTGEMNVNTAKCRSGDLVLQAADSQGATAQMTIRFKITNLTWAISGSMIALILGGIIFAAVTAYFASQKPWRGRLTVRNLANNTGNTMGDFRGSVQLKKFFIGNCGLDGKFVSQGQNRLEFVSKKPVYPVVNGILNPPTKRVPLTNGTMVIYANEAQSAGISVEVHAMAAAGFGPGGMGGMGGGPKMGKRKAAKGPKMPVPPANPGVPGGAGNNPFA